MKKNPAEIEEMKHTVKSKLGGNFCQENELRRGYNKDKISGDVKKVF